jgi:CheY-like chemotaxis protein
VRVFVVEDEFAVLLLMEDMLSTLGCVVVAAASRMSEAIEQASKLEFDAAVLDVNVGGHAVFPVAEILAARRVPIVFSTGYGVSGIEARWRDRPILQKPFYERDLGDALARAMGAAAARDRGA